MFSLIPVAPATGLRYLQNNSTTIGATYETWLACLLRIGSGVRNRIASLLRAGDAAPRRQTRHPFQNPHHHRPTANPPPSPSPTSRPCRSQTLKVHNGHNNQDEVYTGVAPSDLLAKYGVALTDPHKVYHTCVKAQGTDKYWVLYSASELEPSLATWDVAHRHQHGRQTARRRTEPSRS